MITTNVTDRGSFYVRATDPRGRWSDPFPADVPGIDPSLFFDDDGRVYVTSTVNCGPNVHEGIHLAEIDIRTGKLQSQPKNAWAGTGNRYPEGPHLYKKDGWYYLMIAEGGTQFGHRVSIARSRHIDGLYDPNPGNPIMTHANMNAKTSQTQGVRQGDLVQTQDDDWFMATHAFRQTDEHEILGRETLLAPVAWARNAWPVVNGDGTVTATMHAASLPGPVRPVVDAQVDEFDGKRLGFAWHHLHEPVTANHSLGARPSWLRLSGSNASLERPDGVTFVGRRQQRFDFETTTLLEFEPAVRARKRASLCSRTKTSLRARDRRYGWPALGSPAHGSRPDPRRTGTRRAPAGPVELRVVGDKYKYVFSVRQGSGAWRRAGEADTRYLSSVTAGGFTGVNVGLYTYRPLRPSA